MSNLEDINYYIDKYKFFDILPKNLLIKSNIMSLKSKDILCAQGDFINKLFFLVEGRLKTTAPLPNGQQLLLRFSHPLSVVGELEIFNDIKIQSLVTCEENSRLIYYDKQDIINYAYNYMPFMHYINKELGYKLYTLSNAASINLLYPLINRFSSYLLSFNNANIRTYELHTDSLKNIAELLGTSPRHLRRVISKLTKENIIIREKYQFTILDSNALKKYATTQLYI